MTDQKPDRQDGDGLEYALGALRTIAASAHDTSARQMAAIAQAGIDLVERGAAECAKMRGEGAGDDLPLDAEHPVNYRKAFAEALFSAPVPPAADGAGVLETVDAVIDQFENDARVLYPDSEVLMALGRIRDAVSPPSSPAVAAEPVALGRPHVEYSASRGQSRVEYWVSREHGKLIEAGLASPPVRRDREAIAPKAIAEAFSDWAWNKKGEAVGNMLAHEAAKVSFFAGARWAGVPRLPQDTLDRLAMLNVSEKEVYEVLKKHLPEDMIDGIWQEIKEAGRFVGVQPGAGEREWPQPFTTAPRDGTPILARCNDHSEMYALRWDGEHWACRDALTTFGDGLFLPNGDWCLDPFSRQAPHSSSETE